MKSILGVFGLMIGIIYSLLQIKTITYVPFKTKQSPIITFEKEKLVTTKNHYFKLKWAYPDIQLIKTINDLKENQIALLPWNTKNTNLQFIKIKGHAFFNTSKGAVQVKAFQSKQDMYNDFLKQNIEITAGGTVVLARGVHKVIQRSNNINHPWEDTSHLFKQSDINVVNFKSPLVKDFKYPKSSWKLIGKKQYAKGLSDNNIHLVSISGNHMGDAKNKGFLETIQTLQDHNIEYVGGGKTVDEAYRCKKIRKKNTTFGFLSFNNVPGTIGKPTESKPGIAWLDKYAIDSIKNCNNKVDQLIVMVNWGIEYTHSPRKKEKVWANKMVNAGADLILGDQAHWVQQHEKINNKHVTYGLGNYIFDQHWSVKTTEGIIQKFIYYNNEIIAIDTIPIKLSKNGRVKPIPTSSNRYLEVLNAYYSPIKP